MRYHNITKDDMNNGDGLRVVLWVSGCDKHCEGCQNPLTWDPVDGLAFDEGARKEIFEELQKDYISGITLSGGDPLFPENREEISLLCKEIKERFPEKTIWLYTGELWENIENLPILQYLDILIDGPFIHALCDRKLHWKGSSNQRVIDVQKSLLEKDIILYSE